MRIARQFLYTAAVLLLATCAAKIISSLGHGRILLQRDPVTGFLFRDLFRFVSVVELAIALVCFLSKRIWLSTSLVAWLATGFLIYRLVLLWAGYRRPCPCLGNLTDMLNISAQTADTGMKVILGYLLVGSYATLFWLWKDNRKSCIGQRIRCPHCKNEMTLKEPS
jgi:hypothetical protein